MERLGKGLPKISIVTPSLNQGKYLEKTILSILEQNYPNLEHIVIDGGSTDGTLDVIKKYEKYLKYWVSQPDTGQANAINKGLKKATGDLLTWLNSDDYYMPGALRKFAEAYSKNPQAGVFVGIGNVVDGAGKILYSLEPKPVMDLHTLYYWMSGGNFLQPSSVFTKAAWDVYGPLDETFHVAFDVDLWLRMAKRGVEFMVINELLSIALSHENAKTTAFENLMMVDIAIAVIKHGGDHAARTRLEGMAQQLSYIEPNFRKIMNHPVVRVLLPFIKQALKPAVRWRDTIPTWKK
jgi:glycosyltransferase involved in cell wall biosynthesis